VGVCIGKSTYARIGIIVNADPLEPEWKGKVTIEISNTTPLPAKVYAGEGIAQVLFLGPTPPARPPTPTRPASYQNQKGLTLPFVIGSPPPRRERFALIEHGLYTGVQKWYKGRSVNNLTAGPQCRPSILFTGHALLCKQDEVCGMDGLRRLYRT